MSETTFDFGDGRGPVPAHRHPNGGGWVADGSRVDVSTWVFGDACVSGDGDLIVIGPIGSRADHLVMHRDEALGVRVTTGCFSGSWDEFRAAVERRHPKGSRYRQEYEWCAAAAYATLTARLGEGGPRP